jgi:GT2 family glycosyltransferase
VIPSRNLDNLLPCLSAVRQHEPKVRIFIIDDGVEWRDWCAPNGPIEIIPGVKPFIFARNVNLGIQAAGTDDVVILNDDATLESPMGFTAMQTVARLRTEFGLISATTNLAGNPEQHRRRLPGVRECRAMHGNSIPTVAFVCVLIPHRTVQAVGLLDERFTAYGWEDNDYCRRVAKRGLVIGISDDCYVDHARLQSTFRRSAYASGDISAGKRIYLEKWGTM